MKFFKFLFVILMLKHCIVDGTGAGGDVGDVDIDDIDDIDDGATPPAGDDVNKTSTGESVSTEDILNLRKELNEVKSSLNAKEIEEARNSIIAGFKKTYPTFDENKVKDYLVELSKTKPELAKELNTPVGWENIFLKEFAPKEVKNDYVDFGRNAGGVSKKEEFQEKLKAGHTLSIDEQAEYFS